MLILLMFVVMFPGMITGSSTAAVLSAGALVAPVLLLIGIPRERAGAIIAIGAIMGMAAPPVNIPAMLIAGGVDMPYIGFEGPLFLVTIPCAIFSVLFLGLRYCKDLDIDKLRRSLDTETGNSTASGCTSQSLCWRCCWWRRRCFRPCRSLAPA